MKNNSLFCLHAFFINFYMLQNVNTVLGIHVGLNEISWSLLNYNCNVLQWDYESFPRTEKKENIHSLLQKVNIEALENFSYSFNKISLLFKDCGIFY